MARGIAYLVWVAAFELGSSTGYCAAVVSDLGGKTDGWSYTWVFPLPVSIYSKVSRYRRAPGHSSRRTATMMFCFKLSSTISAW